MIPLYILMLIGQGTAEHANYRGNKLITNAFVPNCAAVNIVVLPSPTSGFNAGGLKQLPANQSLVINRYVKAINSIRHWDKIIRKQAPGNLNIHGAATFYYAGNKLKKVVVKQSRDVDEYYLLNGKLCYAIEFYPDEQSKPAVNDTHKDESYFYNGDLFLKKESDDCGAPFENAYLKSEEKRVMAKFRKALEMYSIITPAK